MLQKFNAIEGQSIFDVCLNCYGTIDLMYKLLQDNGIDSINVIPYSGQVFTYDDTLVIDQGINQQFTQSGTLYATNLGGSGDLALPIKGRPPLVKLPIPRHPPSQIQDMYSVTYSTSFTSSQDGTVIVTPVDKDGNSMAGYTIVQIELEIKPLEASQYSWNVAQGILTLLDGTTVDNGQTLFIIYSQMVTP